MFCNNIIFSSLSKTQVFHVSPKSREGPWNRRIFHSKFSDVIIPEKNVENPSRKILKVAVAGRPNVGKSTLINRIVNLNICDVSRKTHTTRFPVKIALARRDVQLVFVDTPGLVTAEEFRRFQLQRTFKKWWELIRPDTDAFGLVYDARVFAARKRPPALLVKFFEDVPESIPVFLVLNKIDLLNEKELEGIREFMKSPEEAGNPQSSTASWFRRKFFKTFLVSALNNYGVSDLVDHLFLQAKEGDWVLESDAVCDAPLHKIIENFVRAKMLNILPHQIPYECSYEVEFLKETETNKFTCVVLITCPRKSYRKLIVQKKSHYLGMVAEEVSDDLFKIYNKVFRVRLVVVS